MENDKIEQILGGTLFGEEPSFSTVVTYGMNVGIIVGTGVALVYLALGLIMIATSQGDKQKIDKAQKWVTYSVIGLVALLMAFIIKRVLFNVAGLEGDPGLQSLIN